MSDTKEKIRRVCPACGETFETKDKRLRYCCAACKQTGSAAKLRRLHMRYYEERHPDLKPYRGRRPGEYERLKGERKELRV